MSKPELNENLVLLILIVNEKVEDLKRRYPGTFESITPTFVLSMNPNDSPVHIELDCIYTGVNMEAGREAVEDLKEEMEILLGKTTEE